MPRSSRPSYHLSRPRPQRPDRRGANSFPQFWLIIAGAALLILVLLIWGLSAIMTPRNSGTPTLNATQQINTTPGSFETHSPSTTPTPSSTPTPTATITPTPQPCKVERNTNIYAEPKKVTIKEAISMGQTVDIYWVVNNDGVAWYRTLINGTERFIPQADVTCK